MDDPIGLYLQARTAQRMAEQDGRPGAAVAWNGMARLILKEARLDVAVVDRLLGDLIMENGPTGSAPAPA